MPMMKKQHGFSMIEVLVAVVVLVFGVLGMAGLQMQAINATEQGRYNSRAAIQAASIATVIKANPSYWTNFSGTVSVVNTTITGGPSASSSDCTSSGAACTASQMAATDLTWWGSDVYTSLPAGNFTVACDITPDPHVCTVTINWSEKNAAGRSQDAGSGLLATRTTTSRSYQTLVSPILRPAI